MAAASCQRGLFEHHSIHNCVSHGWSHLIIISVHARQCLLVQNLTKYTIVNQFFSPLQQNFCPQMEQAMAIFFCRQRDYLHSIWLPLIRFCCSMLSWHQKP